MLLRSTKLAVVFTFGVDHGSAAYVARMFCTSCCNTHVVSSRYDVQLAPCCTSHYRGSDRKSSSLSLSSGVIGTCSCVPCWALQRRCLVADVITCCCVCSLEICHHGNVRSGSVDVRCWSRNPLVLLSTPVVFVTSNNHCCYQL